MILLLDIGNTRMKWALSNGAALSGFGSEPHRGDPAASFDARVWPAVSAVWIGLVLGPEHERRLSERIYQRFGFAPKFARVAAEYQGLRLSYAEPSRLGIDRWLGMLAAWTQHRGAFCIAGAGTALTFDRVDASGRHLGGVIAPGYRSMLRALGSVTRAENDATPEALREGLGQDTLGCIRQGALFSARGVIEQGVRAPGAAADETRILTGGDAGILRPLLPDSWTLSPHLVLEGLQKLAPA